MNIKQIIGICLMVLMSAFGSSADAEEVRISAAASLTEAVKELVAEYARVVPQTVLLPNFASSGALAKQIVAGAPADIYISAHPKWMEFLLQQQRVAALSVSELLQNRLVVVGLQGPDISSLPQLSGLSRIAICSPKASPAGKYAEQALTAAGIYTQLVAQHRLVLAKDVRQALLYAERGEVDAAFVYQSDALLAAKAQTLFVVPQDLYPLISYPAALTESGALREAPRAFYAYLFSAAARQTFQKYGFLFP